ncbi:MAG: KTSC domain-containing protein [Patescibacteria group bacterium]|nr:KTSC domain-containing protein [Patescibacteria group bacterium]
MGSKIRTLADSIRDFLHPTGRKPTPPKVAQRQPSLGHRGIAAGSLKPGEQDFSQENIDKWVGVPADEVEAFVHDQMPLFVHSTNVSLLQYFPEDQKLMVEFLNGGAYLYSNVTETEAYELAKAESKGGFLWDRIRVRGSKTAHKKPFVKLRG